MKLDTGDYMNAEGNGNVLVDTKRSMAEIAQNISGKQHDRFKRECVRAQEGGYRLVILVEDGRYKSVADVRSWTNDHCVKCEVRRKAGCVPKNPKGRCVKHGTLKPIQGPRLSKAMATMSDRYGVSFEFCAPEDAGRRVCELCGVEWEEGGERP